MSWAFYLLQVNIYLAVFYCFYRLLLDGETYFTWNRVYLIAAGFISLLIPLVQVDWFGAQPVVQNLSVTVDHLRMVGRVEDPKTSAFNWGNGVAAVYFLGMLIFSLRLFIQLFSVGRLIRNIPEGSAFSFFNKVVIHPNLEGQDVIHKHEQIHIRQMHSMDVLFFELLSIFNWFNPAVYGYKRAIKNIHEFLADEQAAAFQGSKTQYSMLLLSKAFGVSSNTLTNSFSNKSTIKKRIYMLHKEKSPKTAFLKYGLFLPLFGLTLLLSSATLLKNENIKSATASISLPENITKLLSRDTTSNEWEKFYQFVASNIRYPSAAQEKKLQGNSQISFRIVNGSVEGLDTQAKLGLGCDEQVMQNILAYPGFKNIKDGKYLLNVAFRLNGSASALVNADVKPLSGYNILNPIMVTGNTYASSNAFTSQGKVFDFVSVDTPPQFPGGIEKFYSFIGKSIKYPKEAYDKKVEGKVFMSFIVEENGSLNDIHIDRALGSGTDEEALRVLKASPRWNPGMKNNQPVRVKYAIPISFSMSTGLKSKATGHQDDDARLATINIVRMKPTSGILIKGQTGGPDYIIDGVKASPEDMSKLDSKDIERIDVVKSKSSADQSATVKDNGQIIVTTKAKAFSAKPINKAN
jgi:TonB family protein